MAAVQGAMTAAERSMRSVFVGNIPYEATEEQLKDIFAEVGPVVSFRLVYDRETGKPKGYGFCEYKDQEMALSAMRNLNGYELNGRALRVDNAASEKSKEELKNLQASLGGPPVESPYGPDVPPEKAPEAISRVMCSVPPEQLMELMLQMKQCIENNPNEARNMMIQNPQLAYALLQAQVMLGMIDAEGAGSMLHNPGAQPAPVSALLPTPEKQNQQQAATLKAGMNDPPSFPTAMGLGQPSGPRAANPTMGNARLPAPLLPLPRPNLLGERPLTRPNMPKGVAQLQERDNRAMGDHDLRQAHMMDKELRPPPMMSGDKEMRQAMIDQDLRAMGGSVHDSGPGSGFDPRFRNITGSDPRADPRGMPISRGNMGPDTRGMQGIDARDMQGDGGSRGPMFDRGPGNDPRGPMQRPMPDRVQPPMSGNPAARGMQNPRVAAVSSPAVGGASPNTVSSPRPSNSLAAAAAAIAPHDSEKAALIMQVLQLSDQQIAMLPEEQRLSILILKDQIARSQH